MASANLTELTDVDSARAVNFPVARVYAKSSGVGQAWLTTSSHAIGPAPRSANATDRPTLGPITVIREGGATENVFRTQLVMLRDPKLRLTPDEAPRHTSPLENSRQQLSQSSSQNV